MRKRGRTRCAYLWQHLWQTRRRQSCTRRRVLRHSSKHPVSDPRSTSHWQMKCHPRQEGSRKEKYRRRDRNTSKAKSIREECFSVTKRSRFVPQNRWFGGNREQGSRRCFESLVQGSSRIKVWYKERKQEEAKSQLDAPKGTGPTN